MYNNTLQNEQIYSKFLYNNNEEKPVLASLLERSQKQEIDYGESKISSIQVRWTELVKKSIDAIAEDNPYLPDLEVGQEVLAADAVAWVKGSRGLDCRPKVFDNVSKSWKLCDTGSMITVIKKSKEDKIDTSKILRAVNGSSIKCYGQKEIEVGLGRKVYRINATVADIDQDIIGWDFIAKYKLDWRWSEFGDLCLYDRKANITAPLKFVTVPAEAMQTAALYDSVVPENSWSREIEAFEIASMKLLSSPSMSETPEVSAVKPETELQGKYKKLLAKFPGITEPKFSDLSLKHGVVHKIITNGPPCTSKVRPLMANSEKARKGKEAWDQMLKLGVIERVAPDSIQEFSSPLHLVPKPDGSMRPTSDFRKLNSITLADTYPLPSLRSFSHKLHGSKVFSKIDLQSAFHTIPLDADSVRKTATVTPWGTFVYKRLAFGLRNGPSSFSKLIDTILAGVEGIFTYLDDLLIHAPTEEEHFKILEEVLSRLQENGLSINLPKCKFGQKVVDYLGYEVSASGIRPLKKKVDQIVKFKPPTSQKDLLHFLGALGYFRTSLKGIKKEGVYRNPAEIMQPLFNVATCKLPRGMKVTDIWKQNPAINEVFEECKEMLVNAVELTHPDPKAKLVLCTDSSDYAIGGSLEQQGADGRFHPLGFFSKHLDPSKQRWSTYRKELYGCVQSLRHFLPEFYGRHITIKTDHLPLTKSFESNSLQANDPVAQRQLVEIGMFTKDIQYLPGHKNNMADWLSRKTPEAAIGEAYKLEKGEKDQNFVKEEEVDFTKFKVSAVEELKVESVKLKDIANAQQDCQEIKNLKKGNHPVSLSFANVELDGLTLFCEISRDKPRPVLPPEFRAEVLRAHHSIDHPGKRESARRTCSQYYWTNMRKEINNFVKNCHPCQCTKASKMKSPHIGEFPVPQRRFSHIHVDICGPLPPRRGYKYLLVIICRSTRFVEAVPMTDATTKSCADALLHAWIARHGLASHCTSDNGVEFVSAIWQEMQNKMGIKLNYTPLYSPQTNGLVERQNSTIKTSLKAALVQMGDDYKERWFDFLPWILLMKRVAFQKELDASPALLTYGTNLAVPGDVLRDPGDVYTKPELEELVKFLDKNNKNPAKQTSKPQQTPVEEPPPSVTHVYTKQHNTTGLQSPYVGPFPIESRPTRSTVKIRVGFLKNGQPRYEVRNWRDLKVAHMDPETAEAERPKLGRPAKPTTVEPTPMTSEAGGSDVTERRAEKTENSAAKSKQNSNVGGKPIRSTRNPNPVYVDAIQIHSPGPPPHSGFSNSTPRAWSASQAEIAELNRWSSGRGTISV